MRGYFSGIHGENVVTATLRPKLFVMAWLRVYITFFDGPDRTEWPLSVYIPTFNSWNIRIRLVVRYDPQTGVATAETNIATRHWDEHWPDFEAELA